MAKTKKTAVSGEPSSSSLLPTSKITKPSKSSKDKDPGAAVLLSQNPGKETHSEESTEIYTEIEDQGPDPTFYTYPVTVETVQSVEPVQTVEIETVQNVETENVETVQNVEIETVETVETVSGQRIMDAGELARYAKGLEDVVGVVSGSLEHLRNKNAALQHKVDTRMRLLEKVLRNHDVKHDALVQAQEELEQLRAVNVQLTEERIQLIACVTEKERQVCILTQQRLSVEKEILLNQQQVSFEPRIVDIDKLKATFDEEARVLSAALGEDEDELASSDQIDDEDAMEFLRSRLGRMQV